MDETSVLEYLVRGSGNFIILGISFKLMFLMLGSIKFPESSKLESNNDPFKIFDQLLQAVLILDSKNKVVYANKSAIVFVEEFLSVDLRITAFLPSEFAQKISETGLKEQDNYMNSNVTNQDVMVQIHTFDFPDQPGFKGVEIIKKEFAKDIDQVMKKRIAELENSLNELSYIISHDLVEPVRTIKSFAQIVNRSHIQKLNNTEASEDFEFLLDGADRLYGMIKGMLEYSRLSAKPATYEEIDTLELLVSVIKDLMAITNESNANILCHNMPVLRYNKTLLSQVFSNIINNSLKYRSPDRPPKVEIYAEDTGNEYLFTVADNGIGFNNEQSERIFKMFQRLHPNDSKLTGTGIGLAICKKIIEKENGKIWAEAIEGEGAKFYFTIPKSI